MTSTEKTSSNDPISWSDADQSTATCQGAATQIGATNSGSVTGSDEGYDFYTQTGVYTPGYADNTTTANANWSQDYATGSVSVSGGVTAIAVPEPYGGSLTTTTTAPGTGVPESIGSYPDYALNSPFLGVNVASPSTIGTYPTGTTAAPPAGAPGGFSYTDSQLNSSWLGNFWSALVSPSSFGSASQVTLSQPVQTATTVSRDIGIFFVSAGTGGLAAEAAGAWLGLSAATWGGTIALGAIGGGVANGVGDALIQASGTQPLSVSQLLQSTAYGAVGGAAAGVAGTALSEGLSYIGEIWNGAAENAPYSAIGSTGQVGEDALKALGGESQVYFNTSLGGRYVDQLVGGIANESKVGYQSLTPSIQLQIAKDAELIQTGAVKGATWQFFQSPVTGLGGPSQALLNALQQAGIKVVIH